MEIALFCLIVEFLSIFNRLIEEHDKVINKQLDFRYQIWKKSNGVWSVLFCMNVLCDLFESLKDINFRLFSLKINLLVGIIELTLLKIKHFFHLFLWLKITLAVLLIRSKLFFSHCRGIQFFRLLWWHSKSLICRGKMSLKTNLTNLNTDLTYSIP